MVCVKRFSVDQVVSYRKSRLAKHAADYGAKGNIAHGESVLKSVLLTGFAGYELAAVAGVLAQDADRCIGDKAAGYQAHAK